MSKTDNYRELDFSDDRHSHKPTRRRAKFEHDKPRKKLIVDADDFFDDDDFSPYDDWNDGLGHQFRSNHHY